MRICFITLFPEFVENYFKIGVLGRAVTDSILKISFINPRTYSNLPHNHVDDRPYGGGSGMVLRADIMKSALDATLQLLGLEHDYDRSLHKVVLMSASGSQYTQEAAKQYSKFESLILICGRYEGIDQRFIESYVDESISVGSYVLSGGEIPALAVVDAVVRLIPGVLGNPDSLKDESHSEHISIEYPHYTRPEVFEGKSVPDVLLSGDHKKIEEWRKSHSS